MHRVRLLGPVVNRRLKGEVLAIGFVSLGVWFLYIAAAMVMEERRWKHKQWVQSASCLYLSET